MNVDSRLPVQVQLLGDLDSGGKVVREKAARFSFRPIERPTTFPVRDVTVETLARRFRIKLGSEVTEQVRQFTPRTLAALAQDRTSLTLLDKEPFPYGEEVQLALFNFRQKMVSQEACKMLREHHWHAAHVFAILEFGNKFFPQEFAYRRCTKVIVGFGMRAFKGPEVLHPVLVPDTARASWSLRMQPAWSFMTMPHVLALAWGRQ